MTPFRSRVAEGPSVARVVVLLLTGLPLSVFGQGTKPPPGPADDSVHFEIVELRSVDPRLALEATRHLVAIWTKAPQPAAGDAPVFDVDAPSRRLFVRARKSQIDAIRQLLERLEQEQAGQTEQPRQQGPIRLTVPAESTEEDSAGSSTRQQYVPQDRRRERRRSLPMTRQEPSDNNVYLPAPSGPITIAHIEGTDMLLIRGRSLARPQASPVTKHSPLEFIRKFIQLLLGGPGAGVKPEQHEVR